MLPIPLDFGPAGRSSDLLPAARSSRWSFLGLPLIKVSGGLVDRRQCWLPDLEASLSPGFLCGNCFARGDRCRCGYLTGFLQTLLCWFADAAGPWFTAPCERPTIADHLSPKGDSRPRGEAASL